MGHCYDIEGGTPFLPFVEVLEEMARTGPPDSLRESLGDDAADIARLAPGLRRVFPDLPAPQEAPPEEGQRRLFNAMRDFLGRASSSQAILLVLEDLHWADASTLLLLQHVAQRLAQMPVIVLATYRDVDLAVGSPLAKTLQELLRQRLAHDVLLGRLSEEAVASMLRAQGPGVPPPPLVSLVYSETEGNPFFVEEVTHHLGEEGKLLDREGNWANDVALGEFEVPRGVRMVIQQRLARVSDDCRQSLTNAAVVGRDFSFDVLEAMSALAPEALIDAIEEGLGASLIVEMSQGSVARYSFAHELVRQTLLSGLSLPRRQRLHLKVAETMERVFGRTLDAHVPNLAYHYRQAGPAAAAEKATDYALHAAEKAAAVFAWGEAAAFYEGVLQTREYAATLDLGRKCDVLLSLGDVQYELWENERTLKETAPEAYQLATVREDLAQAAHACWLAVRAIFARFAYPGLGRPDYLEWTSRLDHVAGEGTIHRVRAELALARLAASQGLPEEIDERCRRAMALARRLDAPLDLIFGIGWCHLFYCSGPRYAATRREVGRELASLLFNRPDDGPANGAVFTLVHVAAEALERGDRDEFDRLLDLLVQTGSRADSRVRAVSVEVRDAFVACLDGDFESAAITAASLNRSVSDGMQRGVPSAAYGWMFSIRPNLQLGDTSVLSRLKDSGADLPLWPLALVTNGQPEEARRRLAGALRSAGAGTSEAPDTWPTWMLAVWLEASVLLKEQDLARWFAAPLWHDEMVTTGLAHTTVVRRHLGGAAALLGEPERARHCYERALSEALALRFRPEVALTRLELAELLLDSFPTARTEALEHLSFAVAEFEAMKMRPSLDRARALQVKAGSRRQSRPEHPAGLSEREVEVLRLVAAGKSNREIAAEFVISTRTVERHITNAYNKIGAHGRAAATAYVLGHAL